VSTTATGHRRIIWPCCLAAVAAIGVADRLTGSGVGLALFYLVPVLACAYWSSGWSAFVTAAAATAMWFFADITGDNSPLLWHSCWNATSRFVIFVGVAALTSRLRRDRQALADLNLQLETLLAREQDLSRTDSLTGLRNSRAFLESLRVEVARSQRSQQPTCLAYIDLDDFKQVNDECGHAAGDEVLQAVGAVLRQVTRAGDVPARLGGDEFAVLLADIDAAAANRVAERIIEGARSIRARGCAPQIGASVGVAFFEVTPESAEAVLRAADAAMYRAKVRGKGCVEVDVRAPETTAPTRDNEPTTLDVELTAPEPIEGEPGPRTGV